MKKIDKIKSVAQQLHPSILNPQSSILNPLFDTHLLDPTFYTEPLTVNTENRDHALSLLKMMLIIRMTEEVIATMVQEKIVRCPCHLGIGQEAIPVGIAKNLSNKDFSLSTHRGHALFLALGGSVESLIAETLGRVTGCSHGLGGSMHLIDEAHGFMGSVPIVGGTIPLAAGAALALKFDRKNHIALCFFGDGAIEEGVFHETMNIAASQQLPLLFVCENNLYASHLDIKQRQPSEFISRFAIAHCMDYEIADGNDVFDVEEKSKKLITFIRQTGKPAFLEAFTYRFRGHVGPDENIDVGIRRSEKDLAAWKNRDPIKRLSQGMIDTGLLTEDQFNTIKQAVFDTIETAKHRALKADFPKEETLLDHVYSEKK